ncbi:dTMP kinase [Halothiobacillus sp. DCM-1]|uniref:dTMP kinase n=1 Tax=Halothiobacillus sp. DCM-1 TaxID=3112558 RepID=UPI003253E552
MSPRGWFITLEGIEGAGKTTAAACVVDWLTARGKTVVQTREPGGTPVAESIRQLVLTAGDEPIAPEAELLLMFAARAQHMHYRILPALARDEAVVCDRFTDSSRAYQGAGRGLDAGLIETLAQTVEQGRSPDMTLLLDLPVATGMVRAAARRGAAQQDRFEQERAAFFERVRAGFLAIAERHPRVAVIDAAAPLPTVRAAIEQALAARFGQGG